MKNMQMKKIYVLIQYFIFIMRQVAVYKTSRIKVIKLKIRINNKNQVLISHKK